MSTRYHGLDSLRGLLAFVVFLAHSVILLLGQVLPEVAEAAARWAHAAVMFFFVLSGFVIAMSIDINRRQGFSVRSYALSRVARVMPPLLAAVAVTWIAATALGAVGLGRIGESAERSVYRTDAAGQLLSIATLTLLGDLTGAGLNGPLWTLVYEIQLYVIAGFVAALIFCKPTIKATAMALLAAFLCVASLSPLRDFQLDARAAIIAAFALGGLAYTVRTNDIGRALFVAAVLAAFAVVVSMEPNSTVEGDTRLLLHEIAMSGACALLIMLIAQTGSLSAWRRLGHSAYTLYVLHYPLMLVPLFVVSNVAPRLAMTSWAALIWLASVGCVYFACATIARVVEQPKRHRLLLAMLGSRCRLAFRRAAIAAK